MAKTSPLIALGYDLNFGLSTEIFSGILEYAQHEKLPWQVVPLGFGFESKLMDLARSGRLSGAIGTFMSDRWIQVLLEQHVAAVNLLCFSRIELITSVGPDDAYIGKSAAEHLHAQGARSFTFIGKDEAYFNRIRRSSFSGHCPDNRYRAVDPSWPARLQVDQLKEMEHPVGVLCSNDRIAREICIEGQAIGFKPGQDLLVIGVGDDSIESTFANIGISSFNINAREIGLHAAKALHQQSESPGDSSLHYLKIVRPRLVARESTLRCRKARLAERVVELINNSAGNPEFDITQLCRILGVSRRALELTTRQQLLQSPYQLICEKRREIAGRLLLETKQPIARVGEACGYPEPHHFSAWFKKQTGRSPKEFRKNKAVP